jgi:outer membrane protein assembly factor BamB
VEDDRVYVVTSAGDAICLDANGQGDGNDGPFEDEGRYMVGPDKPPVELTPGDGDILWQYDMITEIGVCPHDAASCSILVHGDMLYMSTSNGVGGPHEKCVCPEAPSFVVLDKRTGRLVAVDDEGIGARMYHAQWSSPSLGKVGEKTLVFFGGGDGVCYAFEAISEARTEPIHLHKVWWYDANPPHYRYRDGKPIPYYAGDKRKKNSPNKNDGRYVGPSQIIATPVFHQGRIYVPIGQDPAHGRGKGMLHCIDATQTGDITQTGRIWSYDALDRSISTVAVAGGLVYAADIAGRIHCLDADTGECCWVHDAGAETWGGPLVADGKLYFGTKRHFFVMTEGRGARVLSKTYLGSPVYSTPIAANGVVYVASQRYLWAVCRTP